MAYDYELIHVELDAGVCFATLDNPPINLITLALFAELAAFAAEVEADESVCAVVLKSANPEFFLAHFDVEAILGFPVDEPARRSETLNDYHLMCERFRAMPKVTICQIEGRVGGGGSELALSCDLRFGVRGKTRICQMEVPLGILPGGTGTQRLPRLVGRGRALEIILGGDDLDAKTAEAWGYLNRALKADEIGPFVDALARRIASFPPEAVALAKASVDAAERPLAEGLAEEAYLFQCLLRTEAAQTNMRRFLEVGGQTRKGEKKVGKLVGKLGRTPS
ncbi:MAG: enoyl-CoA hydratase/isomerase family protein [Pseudomonadales bacterium]|jgi:enoyl-CoA hydratase/carnithine racemase|nr:enoyl-CoA hydratase/isomerase family protein [Pseudomonadales bacterium]